MAPFTILWQVYPELAYVLSEKERADLENDNDPITAISDRLTAFVGHSHELEVAPQVVSTMDDDVKGINIDMQGCLRILGISSLTCRHPLELLPEEGVYH